jgi:hypothetical protein
MDKEHDNAIVIAYGLVGLSGFIMGLLVTYIF